MKYTETHRAVLAPVTFALVSLFACGCVIYYPPHTDFISDYVFNVITLWSIVITLGLVIFLPRKVLGISYMAWNLFVCVCALLVPVIVLKHILLIYAVSEWIFHGALGLMALLLLTSFIFRCRVGGYPECVNKRRVIPGTFRFHIDNHVQVLPDNPKIWSIEEKINKTLIWMSPPLLGASAIIEGSSLMGTVYVVVMSVLSIIFAWFVATITLPDFIFCLMAGFRKPLEITED